MQYIFLLVSLMLIAVISPVGNLTISQSKNYMWVSHSDDAFTCIPITINVDNGARIVITVSELAENHITLSWENYTMGDSWLRFDFMIERGGDTFQDNATEGWYYGEDISATPAGNQTIYLGPESTGLNDRNVTLKLGDRVYVKERNQHVSFDQTQAMDLDSKPFLDRDGWYVFGEAPDYSNTEDCLIDFYPFNAQGSGGTEITTIGLELPLFYKREVMLFNNGTPQTDVLIEFGLIGSDSSTGLRVWDSTRTEQFEYELISEQVLRILLPSLPQGNSTFWMTSGDSEISNESHNLSVHLHASPHPEVVIGDASQDVSVFIGGEQAINFTSDTLGVSFTTPPLPHGYHDLVFELANGIRYKSPNQLKVADYFHLTNDEQYYIIPEEITEITVKLWGAGGGGSGPSNGGAGGFVSGVLDVEPGQNLTLVVGGGGGWHKESCTNSNPSFGGYGGGGSGAQGGGGGGYSAIFDGERLLALVGGGGGSGDGMRGGGGGHGGAGGGLFGQNGSSGVISNNASMGGGQEPYGGTMYLQGGGPIDNEGWTLGGGGGGGYYGGTGGYRQGFWQHRPGGGGSSFIDNLTNGITIAGNLSTSPMIDDPDFHDGVAEGGGLTQNSGCQYIASDGGSGLVVINHDSQSTDSEEEGVALDEVTGLLDALIDLLPNTPQEIIATGVIASGGGAALYFVKVGRYRDPKKELLVKLAGKELDPEINREGFNQRWRILRVVSFMRWITLVLGPVSWGWDEIVYEKLKEPLINFGISEVFTLDGMFEWLFYEALSFLPLGTVESFRRIFEHVRVVSSVLFVFFMFWVYFANGFVKDEVLRMVAVGVDETDLVNAAVETPQPKQNSIIKKRSSLDSSLDHKD